MLVPSGQSKSLDNLGYVGNVTGGPWYTAQTAWAPSFTHWEP